MSGLIVTLAGSMFLIPMLILTSIGLFADIPTWLFKGGLWSMGFSFILGAFRILLAMCEVDQGNWTCS